MARLGYIRARRIKEIEAFRNKVNVDELYVDLLDEFGISKGKNLAVLVDAVKSGDEIVVLGVDQIADDLPELCFFLERTKEIGAKVDFLNEDDSLLLSKDSIKILRIIKRFVEEKEQVQRAMKSKVGRKALKFHDRFYEVYLRYRQKDNGIKAEQAAEILGIEKFKFYELVRLFES